MIADSQVVTPNECSPLAPRPDREIPANAVGVRLRHAPPHRGGHRLDRPGRRGYRLQRLVVLAGRSSAGRSPHDRTVDRAQGVAVGRGRPARASPPRAARRRDEDDPRPHPRGPRRHRGLRRELERVPFWWPGRAEAQFRAAQALLMADRARDAETIAAGDARRRSAPSARPEPVPRRQPGAAEDLRHGGPMGRRLRGDLEGL